MKCNYCEEELSKNYYEPSGSHELYCQDCDTFYNHSGDELWSLDDYNPYLERYAPFGDE